MNTFNPVLYTVTILLFHVSVIAVFGQDECLSGDCENGFGIMKCECGYQFEGRFENGEKRAGKMIKEDLTYEGPFRDDMPHGIGRIIFADGSSYKGDFEYSMPQGTGTYYLSSGAVYSGEMKAGDFHGFGIRFPDSTSAQTYFAGLFDHDRFTGPGIEVRHDDQYIAIGQFTDRQLSGSGLKIDLSSAQVTYGNFKKGVLKKGAAASLSETSTLRLDEIGKLIIEDEMIYFINRDEDYSVFLMPGEFIEIESGGELARLILSPGESRILRPRN